MCLAQGPQRSDAGEAKHSTTEPLRSQNHYEFFVAFIMFLLSLIDQHAG